MTFGRMTARCSVIFRRRSHAKLYKAGADVIGVNCGGGPEQLSRSLQQMHQAMPQATISAMPNAGFPESVGERMMYPATVEYFADYALTFKAIGASIIGGCCGTTPEHIAAMRKALDNPALPLPKIQILETYGDDHALVLNARLIWRANSPLDASSSPSKCARHAATSRKNSSPRRSFCRKPVRIWSTSPTVRRHRCG